MSDPKIREEWKAPLTSAFAALAMTNLSGFLKERMAKGHQIYPPGKEIFAALDAVAPDEVKIVILGQDPYYGPGQAHGLSFSVKEDVPVPPSLVNIYKELESDIGCKIPSHGNLMQWARQGVLLLNAILTVEKGNPLAHKGLGWEEFTDEVIEYLNRSEIPRVFILWGSYAQKKGKKIDRTKHLVLECVHPSPLSAHRGFFGSKPFSKANQFLEKHGIAPIDWEIK